jgi:pimeloyl-ACP methyl ester carboxylesterase
MRLRSLASLVLTLSLACSRDDGPPSEEAAGSEDESSTGTTEESESESETETESETEAGDTDEPLEGYDDPALWLCHPDKDPGDDHCLAHDLSATVFAPDGSTTVVPHTVADDPPFDCFYVYPTVDLRLTPGQTENFNDLSQELDPLLNQAARFTSLCRVFAPLYHQVTIGTFGSAQADELLDAAYQDVAAAFESYRTHHLGDRKLVIMGHSQGTFMTTRLLQEVFEPDPELLDRLIVALLIGGSVSVPEGEVSGGTFVDLPLCESAEQTGCVIAFRTYAADYPPAMGNQSADGPGRQVACTDPLALLGRSKLAGADLPTSTNQPIAFPPIMPDPPVSTGFVRYGDFYTSECLTDLDGHEYLAISVAPESGDVRENLVDFGQPILNPSLLGLHVLDYNFPMAELLELVSIKAAGD